LTLLGSEFQMFIMRSQKNDECVQWFVGGVQAVVPVATPPAHQFNWGGNQLTQVHLENGC